MSLVTQHRKEATLFSSRATSSNESRVCGPTEGTGLSKWTSSHPTLTPQPHLWGTRCFPGWEKTVSLPVSNVFVQKGCVDTHVSGESGQPGNMPYRAAAHGEQTTNEAHLLAKEHRPPL